MLFGIFGWWGKSINFTGMFFEKFLKCEKGLWKLTALVFPNTRYCYILILTAIYYFRPLYITFNGYILLLASLDCDFVRIQDCSAISSACGLKTRLEFSINLLALIHFCFYCCSMVSSINFNYPFENAVLLEILKCWKYKSLFTLRYKWFTMKTSKGTIYIN